MGGEKIGASRGIAGMLCGTCCAQSAPRQPVCPYCGKDESLETCALPDQGRLYSYTVVHVPPEGREAETPYALAIVELEGGARISARVETQNFDRLAIDTPLKLVRESDGVHYFEPC